MRQQAWGISLVEVMMVSITIGILAIVLIPNLVDVRNRAYAATTQTCLKELSTLHEADMAFYGGYSSIDASNYPSACREVAVTETSLSLSYYKYVASHPQTTRTFAVEPGTGIYEQ